jgi:eukaryotic-like serine/threonine-protein kinase
MRGQERHQGTAPVITEDPLEGTPYRSTGVLGQGAMGIVLDAEHRALRKRVCVKVLLERHMLGRPDLVDRMRAEAQALANLRHEGLVEVTDFGTTPAGRPYFAMERLVGRTLKDELDARGHVTLGEALRWSAEALETLVVTHAAGVIHRDLKPANLFLCQGPDPSKRKIKLLDFGVAKIREGAQGVAPLAFPTAEGVAVGTPRYLAPEQVLGHPVDGRSDVYAMALVLCTLVAGRGPFDDAPTDAEMAVARIQRPAPPLSTYAKVAISHALDAAVARALAMNPAHRFAGVGDFAAELRRIERAVPSETHPMPTSLTGTEIVQPPSSSKLQATLAATMPMAGPSRQEIIAKAVQEAALRRESALPPNAAPLGHPPNAALPSSPLLPGPPQAGRATGSGAIVALLAVALVGSLVLGWVLVTAGLLAF